MDGEWLFYCTINLSRLIGILGDSPTQALFIGQNRGKNANNCLGNRLLRKKKLSLRLCWKLCLIH